VRLDWDVDLDDVVVTVDGTEVYRSSQFRADVETISAVVDAINEHENERIKKATEEFHREFLGSGGPIGAHPAQYTVWNKPWRNVRFVEEHAPTAKYEPHNDWDALTGGLARRGDLEPDFYPQYLVN
jgi:hypothetical protein